MCYFLYCAVNNGVNTGDYENVSAKSKYHFNPGNQNDVNVCIENNGNNYRITTNHCDCETSVGSKKIKNDIKELADLIVSFKSVRGIKNIMISKNWISENNTKQETVHIDDVDILRFLADMEERCLYKIELYPKYY